MIDTEGLTKLLTIQAPDPGIVSVYLTVPLDPAQRRGMQAHTELSEQLPRSMAAIGLDACVTAANQHAVQLLVVPDDEVKPGFSCGHCGALAVTEGACQICGEATHAVPDVIEELAVKVANDGGSVEPLRATGVVTDVAARRRFPPPGPPA